MSVLDLWSKGLHLDTLEAEHGLPTGLLRAVMQAESSGDLHAQSRAGAQGIFQFMPTTAKQYAIDAFDPFQAAPAAAKELGTLYKKYGGDTDKTLAAWNWGQGNVDRQGMEQAPQETRSFISTVVGSLRPARAEAAPQATPESNAPAGATAPDLMQEYLRLKTQQGRAPTPQQSAAPALEQLPTVVPSPDPSQPATLEWRPASVSPSTPTTSGATQLLPSGTEMPQGPLQPPITITPRAPTVPGATIPTEPLPEVIPARDPSQPATLRTPGMQQAIGEIGLLQPVGQVSVGTDPQAIRPPARRFDPRTMDDDTIMRELGVDPALVKQSRFYQPGMFQRALVTPGSSGEGLMRSEVGSLMQGVRRPFDAGVQMGTRALRTLGLLSDADVALTDTMIQLKQGEYAQTPRPTFDLPVAGPVQPSELAGSMLVPIPGTRGVLPLQRAGSFLANTGRGLVNAIVGGTVGAVTQPILQPGVPGTPEDTFLAQKVGQAKTGAISGAVTGGVTAPIAAITNKMAGAGRMGTTANVTEEAQRLRQEMIRTPYTSMREIDAAAARGDDMALKLQQAITDAGDDWGKIMQTSGNVALFKKKLQADANYAEVARLAAPLGDVPIPRTLKAIDDAIGKLEREVLPDTATIATLKTMRSGLSPTPDPTTPTVSVPADTSYGRLRDLRSKMGDLITSYYRPHGAGLVAEAGIGKEGITVLPQLQKTLESELQQFARRSGRPELADAAFKADRFYETEVAPYHDRLLANAFKNEFSDEIYHQFIKQGRGERAEYYYKALDPKGQAAVRYGMVTDAFEQAVDPVSGRLDTAKFTQYMHNRQEAQDMFFKGAAKTELDGVNKLLQHDALLQQRGSKLPRLASTLVPGGAGFLAGPVVGAITVGATVGLQTARALMLTERGRRFLQAASTLEPGSGGFQRSLDAALRGLPRAVGTEATAPEPPQQR